MLQNKKNWLTFFSFTIFTICLVSCKKESVFQNKAKPEIIIGVNDGRLSSAIIHFQKDTIYIIATSLTRDIGQTLLIDAGTLIKMNENLSITINPGATIEAEGNASEPIIFTSSAFAGSPGLFGQRIWNGIRIYGNALNNPNSGSGILSFVRIEFAGSNQDNSGLASLLLENVTSQTTIDNIQVSYSYTTPSFEFFGGNCNATNLVSYASGSHDFYIHAGYKGMLQNLLAYRHPFFPASAGGQKIDLGGLFIKDSTSLPIISNLTVLGPDLQTGTSDIYIQKFVDQSSRSAGLITTAASKFHIRNSALLGFPRGGWYLDDKSAALSLYYNESDFTYSVVHCNDSGRIFYLSPTTYPPFTSADFRALVMQSQFANQIFLNSSEFKLADPFNYDINPNPLPVDGSPLLSGANFDGIFSDPFFKKVDYVGALGTDNWMLGWTNFVPLQTHYND